MLSTRSRRVRRAFSRYIMKRHPLRPSPFGEPMFVSKGLLMLLDDSRISINFVLLMVLKAEVISIPVIMISSWNFWTRAARNIWHHTMFDAFLPWRVSALWECERYSSTVGVEFWLTQYLRWLSVALFRRLLEEYFW